MIESSTNNLNLLMRGDSGSSTDSGSRRLTTSPVVDDDDQRFIDINIDSDNDNDYNKNNKNTSLNSSARGKSSKQATTTTTATTTANIFNFNKSPKISKTMKSVRDEHRGLATSVAKISSSASSMVAVNSQKKPLDLLLSNFNEINLYSDYDDEEDDDDDEDEIGGFKRRSSLTAIRSGAHTSSSGAHHTSTALVSPCHLDLSYDLNRKIEPILNSTTLSNTNQTSNYDLSMLNEAMCNDTIPLASDNRAANHSTPLASNSINSIDSYARAVIPNTSPKTIRVATQDDADDTFTSSINQKPSRSARPKLAKLSGHLFNR